jgi:hypothetical protein
MARIVREVVVSSLPHHYTRQETRLWSNGIEYGVPRS